MNMKRQPFVSRALRQRGAVLLIALIVLIAMTLSALTLIRSVNTTNLVAGNLAFRESAVLYAERAAENAIVWLKDKANNTPDALHSDSDRYWAVRQDPDPATTGRKNWDELWSNVLNSKRYSVPAVGGDTDVTGNQVAYVIQRLCDEPGNPLLKNCSRPPRDTEGGTLDLGKSGAGLTKQVYYRITARVQGPRNTVVYTQTIVAL
jgi:Tfp pilus assembly protein PilX